MGAAVMKNSILLRIYLYVAESNSVVPIAATQTSHGARFGRGSVSRCPPVAR